MRIIAVGNLKGFYELHPDAETGIKIWVKKTKNAVWEKPDDIKQTFVNARLIGSGRVIFNINKNEHRLIVKVEYRLGIVFVCFIGTHEEYDDIDPLTVEKF
jgi:mRNA interferase HigB